MPLAIIISDYSLQYFNKHRDATSTNIGKHPRIHNPANFIVCYVLLCICVIGPIHLESLDYPGYKMSITEENIAFVSLDGHPFHMVFPGLSGQEGTVSLESSGSQGYFLRQQHERTLRLERKGEVNDLTDFEQSCSFFLRESIWFENTVCLESSMQPGHWIARNELQLELLPFQNTQQFQREATFIGKFYLPPLG